MRLKGVTDVNTGENDTVVRKLFLGTGVVLHIKLPAFGFNVSTGVRGLDCTYLFVNS